MKESLHQKIYDKLYKQALSLPPHSKLPSENQLCENFSASRMTINKAITRLASKGIIYRKKGSGTYSSPQQKTKSIKFLIPSVNFNNMPIENMIWINQIINGVMSKAAEKMLKFEIIPISKSNIYGEIEWSFLMDLDKNDYVVIVSSWFEPLFDFLIQRECKILFVDSSFKEECFYRKYMDNWHMLTYSKEKAARDVLNCLIESGTSRIALVSTHEIIMGSPETSFYSSCINASKSFNISLSELNILKTKSKFRDMEILKRELKGLYDKIKYDGIIFYDAHNMYEIASILKNELKMEAPEDISYITWMGDTPSPQNEQKRISSLKLPLVEMGQTCANIVADGNYRPGETHFTAFLDLQDTTKTPKK